MATEFTKDELAFLDSVGAELKNVHCMCGFEGHGGKCMEIATVTIKLHIPHVCKQPRLAETHLLDQNGNITQLLCTKCFDEVRTFAESKLAQTIARCAELSSVCQQCSYPLGHPAVSDLTQCPHCGQPRILFSPVCGAGVTDKDGNSYGCGLPLRSYTDIIRHEEWLNHGV